MHQPRILILFAGLLALGAGCAASPKTTAPASTLNNNISKIPMSYHTNILKDTQDNTNFRRVLFTGSNSQLVIMSIPPGGEVGAETHKYTEQTLFSFLERARASLMVSSSRSAPATLSSWSPARSTISGIPARSPQNLHRLCPAQSHRRPRASNQSRRRCRHGR